MKLSFKSKRLVFRPLTNEDQDLIAELWTDPDVTRYVGGICSRDELIDDYPMVMRRCGGGCIGIWTLSDIQTGEQIGTAILLPMPVEEDDTNWDLVAGDGIPEGDIEIGYILKTAAWGMGYATEACKRLIKFAFEETPLTELVATTDPENLASQQVLLKSGMQHLGQIKAYAGEYPGFRITKKQWCQEVSVAS